MMVVTAPMIIIVEYTSEASTPKDIPVLATINPTCNVTK